MCAVRCVLTSALLALGTELLTPTAAGQENAASPTRPVMNTSIPEGTWEITGALGMARTTGAPRIVQDPSPDTTVTGLLQVTHGVTDRFEIALAPILSYRGGDHGGLEWLPWAGLTAWSIGYSSIEGTLVAGHLGLGVDIRGWIGNVDSIVVSLDVVSGFFWRSGENPSTDPVGRRVNATFAPTTWRPRYALGWTHSFGAAVTTAVGARLAHTEIFEGELTSNRFQRALIVSAGSILRLGPRPLPLVRVHLGDVASIDLYAHVSYRPVDDEIGGAGMGGATFIW